MYSSENDLEGQEKARKAEKLLCDFIDQHEIPLYIWISVMQAFAAKTYRCNNISKLEYKKSMKSYIKFYEDRWDE